MTGAEAIPPLGLKHGAHARRCAPINSTVESSFLRTKRHMTLAVWLGACASFVSPSVVPLLGLWLALAQFKELPQLARRQQIGDAHLAGAPRIKEEEDPAGYCVSVVRMKVPLHVLQARKRRNQIVDIVLLLAEGEKGRWSVNKSEGVGGQQKDTKG